MKPEDGTLHVFDDAAALAQGAAEWLTDRMRDKHGHEARVALSGGSTPKPVYQAARLPLDARFPWDDVQFFIGDERFCSDHRSGQQLRHDARRAVRAGAGSDRNSPVPTEGVTIEQAADAYQKVLAAVYGADTLDPARPLFDVVLLGLGDDGHRVPAVRAAGARRHRPLGRAGHARPDRAADHAHLSRPQQCRACRLPRQRRRQAGDP